MLEGGWPGGGALSAAFPEPLAAALAGPLPAAALAPPLAAPRGPAEGRQVRLGGGGAGSVSLPPQAEFRPGGGFWNHGF